VHVWCTPARSLSFSPRASLTLTLSQSLSIRYIAAATAFPYFLLDMVAATVVVVPRSRVIDTFRTCLNTKVQP
jgi:hypothetical protein